MAAPAHRVNPAHGTKPVGSVPVPSRPFRFGLQAMRAESARQWRDIARRAEGLGYSTLLVADHYLGPGPVYERSAHLPQNLAPIAAIATAAGATEDLRVGCRVFAVDFHVPAVLAAETATLDLLSDGRLEVGIGAGVLRDEFEAMGVRFDEPRVRIDRLTEVVRLLKAHWSGQQIEVSGEHVHVSGYSGLPAPVQKPHPPIMIGGQKRRLLSLAGREAQIASINFIPYVQTADGLTPWQEMARRLGYVRDAAGDRFAQIELEYSPYDVNITDDVTAAYEEIAARRRVPVEAVPGHPNALVGSPEAAADLLRQWREITGISYVTVPHTAMETFSPVVARLRGT
jgi:probable F420-dependent oxidoreductase